MVMQMEARGILNTNPIKMHDLNLLNFINLPFKEFARRNLCTHENCLKLNIENPFYILDRSTINYCII
jgi:hypothetical protein